MNEIINNVLTMSSLDIAELTGKAHSDVLKDIRSMEEGLGEGKIPLSSYKSEQNKELP